MSGNSRNAYGIQPVLPDVSVPPPRFFPPSQKGRGSLCREGGTLILNMGKGPYVSPVSPPLTRRTLSSHAATSSSHSGPPIGSQECPRFCPPTVQLGRGCVYAALAREDGRIAASSPLFRREGSASNADSRSLFASSFCESTSSQKEVIAPHAFSSSTMAETTAEGERSPLIMLVKTRHCARWTVFQHVPGLHSGGTWWCALFLVFGAGTPQSSYAPRAPAPAGKSVFRVASPPILPVQGGGTPRRVSLFPRLRENLSISRIRVAELELWRA